MNRYQELNTQKQKLPLKELTIVVSQNNSNLPFLSDPTVFSPESHEDPPDRGARSPLLLLYLQSDAAHVYKRTSGTLHHLRHAVRVQGVYHAKGLLLLSCFVDKGHRRGNNDRCAIQTCWYF